MSTISFDCEVTEYDVIPPESNKENIFCINEKCLVINICGVGKKILIQSEISKEDAIQLAKLILIKYT